MTPAFEALGTLAVAGGSLVSAMGMLRLQAAERWRHELVCYELRFPRGLDEQAVVTFMSGLAGLVPARSRRWLATHAVVFEAQADERGIHHRLLFPESYSDTVLPQLRAPIPGTRVTPVPVPPVPVLQLATQLDVTSETRALGDGRAAASAALIAALGAVRRGETAVVQWIVAPTAPTALPPELPKSGRPTDMPIAQLMRGMPVTKEERTAYIAKHALPVFVCAGRIGVAASPERARGLLVGLLSGLHHLNAPGAHLQQSSKPSATVIRAMINRKPPMFAALPSLNAAEVTGVVAWPLGMTNAPGLELGSTRQLAPHPAIAQGGRIIGASTYPGSERPLALGVSDSLRHLHVIGPTGVGKSTLLLNLIVQDLQAGRGVVVIDPKRDLVEAVLERMPAGRVKDVILLDPTDEERPVGLNPLSGGESPELVVEQTVGVLHGLFKAFWGPRTDDILRASLSVLATQPGMTLVEVPLLLTDKAFRRRMVAKVNDPVALGPFWAWYEALSDAERAAAIGPVMNKLRAFLLRRRVRNVIGQADAALDLEAAIATNKVVLVSLSKGLLGEEAAQLVGSLVVAKLWQAVQARAGAQQGDRPPVFAYVDEMQDYLNLPTSLADLLAQARGLGLGMTLAHQHLGQLPTELRKAVMANARSRVIFQTSADDGRVLAKELAPYLGPEDLQVLGPYEVVATLAAGAQVTPPVTARTYGAPPVTGQAEAARAASRARYGRDRMAIEAAMTRRHGGAPEGPDDAVGRREVRS